MTARRTWARRPSPSTALRHAAAFAVVVLLTVVLAQSTTTAAFTGSTSDANNTVAAAPQFCTSPGPAPATGAVDAALYQAGANASQNYSSGSQIGVGASNNAIVRTLIKFDLPPRPPGCVLSSATLSMRMNTASAPSAPVEVYRAGASWNVATVTWNSWTAQPTQTVGSPVSTTSLAVGAVQTWDVTTLVRDLYAGPDNGFLMKDPGEGSGVSRYNLYDSMDVTTVSYRPQLSVTWD